MMTSSTTFIPPMRHGVSASKVFLKPTTPAPTRIFEYLCAEFQHIPPSEWQQRFADGLVYDDEGNVLNQHAIFTPNRHVFYYRFLSQEIKVPFQHQILFENEHLMVVDKPHFLTMSPTGQYVQETLLVRLKQQTGNPNLSPIHRLDRETAGVVLFAKTTEARGPYQQMFAERLVQKSYHAIAAFDPALQLPQSTRFRMEKADPFYTMQIVDGKPNSETLIELIEHNTKLAKYLLKPLSGKQHQLRLHLSTLGIPILNDPFYPKVAHKAEDDFSQPLQLLAKNICFRDPLTSQDMAFSSNLVLTL